MKVKISHVQLFVAPCTIQSMEFSRPEYWSGQLFPAPGDLPKPGIKPRSPTLQVDSVSSEPPGKPIVYQCTNFRYGLTATQLLCESLRIMLDHVQKSALEPCVQVVTLGAPQTSMDYCYTSIILLSTTLTVVEKQGGKENIILISKLSFPRKKALISTIRENASGV